MYKNKNRGMGNGMRGTWGMRECYIPGNVAKHSGNVAKHSGEGPQTFRKMSPNILGNAVKHSEECSQTFRGLRM